jgi:hypothetical protein
MSLVVLSNEQTFNESSQPQNIEAPNRFQNYFSKPIEVPEDAEVAVVSAKINRTGDLSIDSRKNFKVYLGEELGESKGLDETTSLPISVDLFDRGGDNSLSPEEFAIRVQESLDVDLLHPEFIERTVVSASLSDTDNSLQGFKFVYSASLNGSGNSSAVSATWDNFTGDSFGNASVSASGAYGQIIEGLGEGGTGDPMLENSFIGTERPLAPSGGIFEFEPSNGSNNETVWTVGLARPLTIEEQVDPGDFVDDPDYYFPSNFDQASMPDDMYIYNDFAIQRDIDGNIRAYQSGFNPAKNSASFTTYRFRLENEKMFIEGYDWVAARYISICSPVDTAVPYDQVTKPVSQNEWSLYPTVNFTEANDSIYISRFNGAYKPGGVDMSYLSESYYGVVSYVDPAPLLYQTIDSRRMYDFTQNQNHTYVGLRGTGSHQSVDKNVVMILADEELYTPKYVFPIPNYDMTSTLGYDRAIINETTYATLSVHDSVRTFVPTNPPIILINIREAFIKLDSLTIESFNGATSDISKIIYGIPRFDNAGGSTGSLYFSNNDRYYLKLNNTSPLLLNRMDVSLVSIDNKLVQDLFGSTTITLHIRKSLK